MKEWKQGDPVASGLMFISPEEKPYYGEECFYQHVETLAKKVIDLPTIYQRRALLSRVPATYLNAVKNRVKMLWNQKETPSLSS